MAWPGYAALQVFSATVGKPTSSSTSDAASKTPPSEPLWAVTVPCSSCAPNPPTITAFPAPGSALGLSDNRASAPLHGDDNVMSATSLPLLGADVYPG